MGTLFFLLPIQATGNQAGFFPSPRKQSQTETHTTTMANYDAEKDPYEGIKSARGMGGGKTAYNGSPIHTEHYICDCGWVTKFNSGDEAGVAKRMDLIVRLHRKKCPITNTGKFVEKTEFKIPKKGGKVRIVDKADRPI